MRVPRAPGFRLDMGKTHAGRRIRDADEDIASRALNLPAGELGLTFQGLVAVGTIELEFSCFYLIHKLLSL